MYEQSRNIPNSLEQTCWICLEATSRKKLVRACSCSLKAHELCLLNWIDYKQNNRPLSSVKCPQCQFSYVLINSSKVPSISLFKQIDVLLDDLVPFAALFGFGSIIWIASTVYGAYAAFFVAGPQFSNYLFHNTSPEFNWRAWLGLPMIPFILIASRSKSLESVVHILPLFIIDKNNSYIIRNNTIHLKPTHVLALLPLVRLLYNSFYEIAIGQQERKWEREVNNRQFLLNSSESEYTAEELLNEEAITAENNRGNALIIGGHDIKIRTIVGALIFPVISACAGTFLGSFEVVRKRIPLNLYRNIIGGCLFVFIKDIVNIFYKYSLAKQTRTRRIKTFE